MKNLILQPGVRQKIDRRVDKILSDLGSPEPPLRLEDVRELLKLDLEYYQSDSDNVLRRAAHKLIMSGKQVFARPGLLLDVVRKRSIKALWVPDRKRILIDENLHKAKHRWAEGHETMHSVLEWHEPVLHGDNELTMKQACLDKVEAEANYGSGQLLFLRERFINEVLDSPLSIGLIKKLSEDFKNTKASTLWRIVEAAGTTRPLLGVMHFHPHPRLLSDKHDPKNPCRHFIQSDAFAAQFSAVTGHQVFEHISTYVLPRRGGPVGGETIVLIDDNGDEHEFAFETFNFVNECLTLAIHMRKRPVTVSISV